MAIIDGLGLQVTILISGVPALEFPDDDHTSASEKFGPNTKQCHNYVQCVKDAEFSIKCELSSPSEDIKEWLNDPDHVIVCNIDLDGER